MDIAISQSTVAKRNRRRSILGLTIVEMMITMGIFGFAMTAFLYAYIFGLKQDQLVQSKCGASDESRRSFEKVARDIRCANSHAVGNYTGGASGTFTPCLNGSTNFSGNALQIFLAAAPNTNSIIYYFDTTISTPVGSWKLYRLHTGDTAPTAIALALCRIAPHFPPKITRGLRKTACWIST